MTEDELREFMRWIVECSVHTPFSVMVIDKTTGKVRCVAYSFDLQCYISS